MTLTLRLATNTGVYAVASWAVHALRLPRLPAETVVLRTRPDILWEGRHAVAFGLARLQHHFRSAPLGERLMLGQEFERPNAQGDVLMITSWGAYERHVALPLLESRARLRWGDLPTARLLHNLGLRNGWGYGRSMLGGGGGATPLLLLDRCVCLAGGTACARPSCLLPVAEAYVMASKYVLRAAPAVPQTSAASSSGGGGTGSASQVATTTPLPSPKHSRSRVELGGSLFCYCPTNWPNASTAAHAVLPGGAHRIAKPWLSGGTLRCKRRLALSEGGDTPPRGIWPVGCGPPNFLDDRIVALPRWSSGGGGGGGGGGGAGAGAGAGDGVAAGAVGAGGAGGAGGGGGRHASRHGKMRWAVRGAKAALNETAMASLLEQLERLSSQVLADVPPDPEPGVVRMDT